MNSTEVNRDEATTQSIGYDSNDDVASANEDLMIGAIGDEKSLGGETKATPTSQSDGVFARNRCLQTLAGRYAKRAKHVLNDACKSSQQYGPESIDEGTSLSLMKFSVDEDLDNTSDVSVGNASALTTLAIAASFRSISSVTPLHRVLSFSPIRVKKSERKEVTMILSSDVAHIFEPTPIKGIYPDLSRVFGDSPLPSLCDGDAVSEALSKGTVGSFSSPLRTSVKSAFTPIAVADMKNRTTPEFYEPFVGFTRTLFAAVGVSNKEIDTSSSASISSLGDSAGSPRRPSSGLSEPMASHVETSRLGAGAVCAA
jgi:hypothetical protein